MKKFIEIWNGVAKVTPGNGKGATVYLMRGAYGEDGVHFGATDLYLNALDTRSLYDALKAVYEPEGGAQ